MPGTFSQIYIHIIFSVKGRHSLISPEWEEELYKYISGIIRNKGQKTLAINGIPNHIHILVGMRPSCCLSDLVREIKKASCLFVKEKRFTRFNFQWQEGFGGFSYNHSSLNHVIRYINNQKEHHKQQPFKDEYISFLKKFNVEYKEEHLFEWLEEYT